MTQNGKGSTPRPYSVTQDEFAKNWEKTFGKSPKKVETKRKEKKVEENDVQATQDEVI